MALIAQADWSTLLDVLDKGGTLALLVLVVVGAARGWWHPSRVVAERDATIARLIAERNRFLDLALRSTSAAKGATDVMRSQRDSLDAETIAHRAAIEALERAREDGML